MRLCARIRGLLIPTKGANQTQPYRLSNICQYITRKGDIISFRGVTFPSNPTWGSLCAISRGSAGMFPQPCPRVLRQSLGRCSSFEPNLPRQPLNVDADVVLCSVSHTNLPGRQAYCLVSYIYHKNAFTRKCNRSGTRYLANFQKIYYDKVPVACK